MKLVICAKLLIIVTVVHTAIFCNASPHPGIASSALVSPQKGLFYSYKGFNLEAPISWQIEREAINDDSSEISVYYLMPKAPTATLSLKTDSLKNQTSLESYAKKWMKDYSSYGFDVLGARTFSTKGARGLVVDLIHKKKSQQIRQAIFVNKKIAVTITCMDKIQSFPESLSSCNQVFKNFSWLSKN